MRIQALRGMVGSYGTLRRGQVAEIDDHIARKLIKAGRVIAVDEAPADPSPAPEQDQASGAKKKTDRQSGGRAGAAKPASSSPADQAPEPSAQTSPPSEGAPA